jgi:hypothetical protein
VGGRSCSSEAVHGVPVAGDGLGRSEDGAAREGRENSERQLGSTRAWGKKCGSARGVANFQSEGVVRQQPAMRQLLEDFFGLKVLHSTGYLSGVAKCRVALNTVV